MKKKLDFNVKSLIDSSGEFENKEQESNKWEDPLVLKKKGIQYLKKKDISYYKKKIIDENYLEHAINRIALELSHFILKDD